MTDGRIGTMTTKALANQSLEVCFVCMAEVFNRVHGQLSPEVISEMNKVFRSMDPVSDLLDDENRQIFKKLDIKKEEQE